MKVLKAALCLAMAAAMTIPAATPAVAESGARYARADTKSVLFCEKMDASSALFIVPYTYCVEIIAEYGEWYRVKYARDEGMYAALNGYCQKDGLTPVQTPPENIYLDYPITATLRSSPQGGADFPWLELTVQAAYYGEYYDGYDVCSYVRYDNKFCYVSETLSDYPLNEIPAEPAFSASPAPSGESNAKLITALVIFGLAASAVVALTLTGKRNRRDIKR